MCYTITDKFQNSVEIIDLRSLIPWDKELVLSSIKKTNRSLILHEATYTSGFGAEISATISEYAFEYLDAPIIRLGSLNTPVPFAQNLENNFLPKDRFEQQIKDLLAY